MKDTAKVKFAEERRKEFEERELEKRRRKDERKAEKKAEKRKSEDSTALDTGKRVCEDVSKNQSASSSSGMV